MTDSLPQLEVRSGSVDVLDGEDPGDVPGVQEDIAVDRNISALHHQGKLLSRGHLHQPTEVLKLANVGR